jgi:glycosyltransferase involved in cell wall biosynthesis
MTQGAEPTIAVIVPNRNDARYLPRCLRSVLEQNVGPDELIIVDDQSTDDSVAVIRSLIANRPNAQLIENPVNLGTYGAIDTGIKRSRSEYLLCLSSNDFVLPGIFAHAKSCLARFPSAGLWSAMGWLVDELDRPIRRHQIPVIALEDAYFTPEQCLRLAWRYGNWFMGTTLTYRRDTLNAAGGFDPAYKGLSDLLTALIVASRGGAAYSPAPLAVVRIHAGSSSSSTLENAAGLETMLERLRERGPKLAPRLFTPAFLDRTAKRFRYGAVRASHGANLSRIAERFPGWRGRALAAIDTIVPSGFRRTRFALAFVILRPFDIVPALWIRLVGGIFFVARRPL